MFQYVTYILVGLSAVFYAIGLVKNSRKLRLTGLAIFLLWVVIGMVN